MRALKVFELKETDAGNQWLIENLIPTGSLALLSAPPKHGKSMIALDVLTSICSGAKAMGEYSVPVKGKALYFALEDTATIIKGRAKAFCQKKKVPLESLDLFVYADQPLLIDTPEGKLGFENLIKDIKPSFVVLDNLARIHTSNENNAAAMGEIFEYLKGVTRLYNCTVLVICHSGKDSKIRGSSQIDSYYEAGIFLRTKGSQLMMDTTFRGFPSVADIPYKIVSDDDGLSIAIGDTAIEAQAEDIAAKEVTEPEYTGPNDLESLVKAGILVEYPPGVFGLKKD